MSTTMAANPQEVTRQLFQQAQQLAKITGWSVFVKVVSATDSAEFCGTDDLKERYRTSGLRFEPGDNESSIDVQSVLLPGSELEGSGQNNDETESLGNVHKECEQTKDGDSKTSVGDIICPLTDKPEQETKYIENQELKEHPYTMSSVLATLKKTLYNISNHIDTSQLEMELENAIGEVQKYMSNTSDGKTTVEDENEERTTPLRSRSINPPRWDDSRGSTKTKFGSSQLGKRKRGRPKKHILEEGDEEHVVGPQKVVRRRGRPRKYPEYTVDSIQPEELKVPEEVVKDESGENDNEDKEQVPGSLESNETEQSNAEQSNAEQSNAETKDAIQFPSRCSTRKRGLPKKYHEFEVDSNDPSEIYLPRKSRKSTYICMECGETFASVSYLETHMNRHRGIKPHTCDVCQKSFLHANSLKIHKVVHSGEKSYVCDVCQKAFAQASTLRDHKVTHTNERPHKCKVCSKGFTQRGSLLSHIRIHTGEKPYKCDLCGKAFTQANGLRTHKLAHSGEKPYKCSECDRAFNTIFKLKAHKPIHADKMPFPCDKCDKAFSMSCQLRNHYRKYHLNERPYLCEECGKSFADTKTLYHHKKVHTGTRQYKCQYCEKSFYNQSSLIKHERIHTGEKPFVCDECGKAFNRSDNLRSHKKIHSSEPNEHACGSCDKKFRALAYLKKHMETSHALNGDIHEHKLVEVSQASILQPPVSLQPSTTTTTIILEQGVGGTEQVQVQGQEALSTVTTSGTTYVLQVDPSMSLPAWDSQVEVPRYTVQAVQEVLDSEVQTAAAMLLSATQQSLTDRQ